MGQQSIELIELCAEPGRERVPSHVFRLFIEEFIACGSRGNLDGRLGAHVQGAYFVANKKPSFDKILAMCFAHGVGIKDVLLRPKEAASPGLFPVSSSSTSALMPIRNYSDADRLASVVDDLAWFTELGYVPKPQALLAAIGLPIGSFMALPEGIFDKYVADTADRQCPWAASADAALRHAVKKLSRAITTDTISKCVADLSKDRRCRKIREYNAISVFALAAARIALHLGAMTEVRSGNLEARFRPCSLAIMGQTDELLNAHS